MKVLVISSHPDDETLGCAGTILKHRENGDSVDWIIATSPQPPTWSKDVIAGKEIEIENVSKAYGIRRSFKLGFAAAMLDTVPMAEVVRALDSAIREIKPEIVYLIHGGDVHTDHQIVFNATLAVLKPFRMAELGVRRILAFETLSSTDAAAPSSSTAFIPNIYIEISDFIDRKLEIMAIYESESQPDPLPRGRSAITALARYRGAVIAADYAEAFMLIREIG